ncbi:unnamed protein product [Polarella glacialis]|uniref:Thioesterase domain-containing protein n=1 Tax=Polarella glacialis TaxID=89957 RepID=A0A813HG87_POLGL|nr:unnamed protein product [Polarella glacialis]CAE8712956.1 unnamed protein product [Polarella glacialis]
MPNPFIEEVLAKYPGVDRVALVFPPEADDWNETEVDLFIGSGGFLKPKKKKTAPASAAGVVAVPRLVSRTLPLPALATSDWWVNNPNPQAKVRLFCAMGIGSVASTYGPWVSKATAEAYPEVEICVVEFPGHGTNFGEPLNSVEAAADRLEAEIRRCHFGTGGSQRPLALFGFSMGANVMYCVARRLGASCCKLYLAGRAPPHFPAPIRDQQAPQIAKVEELLQGSDIDAVAHTLLEDVLPLFMAPAQLKTYTRIIEGRLLREEGRQEIRRFAQSLVADCRIGMDANELPRDFAGDISFYHSTADETWPSACEGLYQDFPHLWQSYTTGTFATHESAPVSHDELGSVTSPIFNVICKDLAQLFKSC